MQKMSLLSLAFAFPIISGEKVLSENIMLFPNTAPGKEIKVQKVFDDVTRKMKLKCDSIGKDASNIEFMRKEEIAYLKKKYGAINGVLRKEIMEMRSNDSVEVVVTLMPPKTNYLDKTKFSKEECSSQSLQLIKTKPEKSIRTIFENSGIFVSKPINETERKIIGKLTKKDIESLKHNPSICNISKHIKPEPCAAPLSSAAASAYNPAFNMPSSAKGSSVRAATFETGIWENHWSYPNYVNHFGDRGNLIRDNIYIDNSATEHSQVCFSMLWYAAPEAQFYHKYGFDFGCTIDDEQPQAIISNNLKTVSCSYSSGSDCNDQYHLMVDEFAYIYPYPVFCNPAANTANGPTVNWQCYNAISVGSFKHVDLANYALAGHSLWQNPSPVYGQFADREMPYILATGEFPYVDQSIPSDDDCGTNNIAWAYEPALKTSFCPNWQGTSLAAPTANGIAACIISSRYIFSIWPEMVRTAMILTAQNCDGNEWSAATDGKDGTGAVSGSDAVAFAMNCTNLSSPNSEAVETGIFASSWYSQDNVAKKFNIQVPASLPVGKHLRVVLTWDSRPDIANNQNYLTDLDLYCSGTGVYDYSVSWEGNVEVVDIPREQLTPGQTIEASAFPSIIRFPYDPSKNWFYYSIGWTWVKDHAD